MKHLKYILIFAALLCINSLNVKALSCPNNVNKELTQAAYYVKSSYEVIDRSIYKELVIDNNKTTYKIPRYDFLISIYNITDDMYVTISDDVIRETLTIKSSDTNNGTYTFTNKDIGRIYNYTISLYSAKEECYGELIKTLKLAKPMYNAYSEYTYCQNSSNYYCQKFTTNELKLNGSEDFFAKIAVNNNKRAPINNESKDEETASVSILDNWKLYAGIFIGVIIITISVLIINRKKNTKKGWEV